MDKARKRSTEKFREMQLGLVAYWGGYSVFERGEWVMLNKEIPKERNQKLAPNLNPTRFNADKWESVTKSAGKRHVTIAVKHHDSVCTYDSDLTYYKTKNISCKKDSITALVKACQNHKMALILLKTLMQ